MNENSLNREPQELVQLRLPRCANMYGCGNCEAGNGSRDTSALSTNFTTSGINGWSSGAAAIERIVGGIRVTNNSGTGYRAILKTVTAGNGFSGSSFRYIVVHGRLKTLAEPTSSGQVLNALMLFTSTTKAGFAGNGIDAPVHEEFRGTNWKTLKEGQEFVLVFDAAEIPTYATDWQGQEITGLQISIINNGDNVFDLYSVQVMSENLYENRGGECYNTRATCEDPNNYRDKPDRNLEPTLSLGDGDTIGSGDLTRTSNLFFSISMRFASEPDGVLWELGGDTDGAYLGVTSGNLVFRAGDGSVASGPNTGKISVSAADLAGRTDTLYGEIEFNASSTCYVRLWRFCPCSLNLVLLGEDSWTDVAGEWAEGDAGAVGEANNLTTTGESNASWNGRIENAYFYDDLYANITELDEYKKVITLGRGVVGEPTDQLPILPCLQNLSTLGTRINIAGSDDNYEPLGRRASVNFSCTDFVHSDIGQDRYVADRLVNPRSQSTFWRKWLVREKFGKVNASVKVYDGYAGQALSEYRVREYLLDMAQYNEDAISFRARDILSLTEFRRAQVPAPSTGILKEELNETALSFVVFGDVRPDYPASGTVRINDEIIRYSELTYDSGSDETTFSMVDSSYRGSDGSEVAEHDVDDLVQLCRRYTNDTVSNVLLNLLMTDAGIPAQQVAVDEIETEDELYLSAYKLTTLITEPTSVSRLIGKLSEECSFYIWWDERDQRVRMQAIRGLDIDEDVQASWAYEKNIVGGSMKIEEKPKQRLNVIDFYYNPSDFAGALDKPSNFKNGLQVINGTSSLPEQYGNYVQIRTIFSRWLSTEAQANQTSSRLALRFADVPQYLEFMVDAKDRAIWTGDFVTISHPLIVDEDGNRIEDKRWLVVEGEEIDPGHLVRYRVADVTLDGLIYRITVDGLSNYTAALFAAGNAFITDDDGLNSDGTEGARLA